MPTLKKQKGFTLIELMVTIAIIAILATVGAVVYSTVQKTARISKRIQDLEALKIAVETYKASNGFYPKATTLACIGSTAANTFSNTTAVNPPFTPTFMQNIPRDPSNSTDASTIPCYQYRSNSSGTEYKIVTNNSEMIPAEYAAQNNYLDTARDGGANSCTLDGTTYSAWSVYSSVGVDPSLPNACGY